ncbi:MAG: roadblock/LC7 domain-containing protein [Armatimonadota bacterium]|nr:roadblock/LC7 domain-containing protein [Armatimonadota bacterium]MDR7401535.1 roadblock/LC7 domain-containing protein [Armatimonadota bacterium]MDR7403277.1 roadblock/LC7 domain-containing protein [Armatimonadota bacterium]MDR7437653.1 roadblock/LC7 domain-containing protein [Armatimonadota bacterium]MDR7471657.1 roadblock/LC7 domain-containing protein [Armatimonadota bacterium]
MEKLSAILWDIKRAAGALGVVVSSGDGLVLDTAGDPQVDPETLAAYAASGLMVGERLGDSGGFGPVEALTILYGTRAVVLSPAGPAVAVLVGPAASAGALRLALLRHHDALARAVREEFGVRPSPETSSGADLPAAPPPPTGAHPDAA